MAVPCRLHLHRAALLIFSEILVDAVNELAVELEPVGAERHDAVKTAGARADVVNGDLKPKVLDELDLVL